MFYINRKAIQNLVTYLDKLGLVILKQLLVHHKLPVADMSGSQALYVVIPDKIPVEAADLKSYRGFVQEAIRRNDAIEPARRRTAYTMRCILFKPPHGQIPQDFWPLVTQMAWGNHRFQYMAAKILETSLRERVLFNKGGFQTMPLSCQTIWLLVSMTCAQRLAREKEAARRSLGRQPAVFSLYSRLRTLMASEHIPTDHTVLEALRTLMQVGEEQIRQSGWASAWDQWVLCEALALALALDEYLPELAQTLRQLPLYVHRYGEEKTESGRGKKLASKNWKAGLPAWFVQWEGLT